MLCNTPSSVERALNAVRTANRVVLDVETSGIDRWNSHIIGWVFTTGPSPDESFYIPVRHAGGGNLPGAVAPGTATGWDGGIHPVERDIASIMGDPNRTVLAHNAQFDLWFAHRHGVAIGGRVSDTMLNQSLINEYLPSYSLDACCKEAKVQAKLGAELYAYLASKFQVPATNKAMSELWRTDANVPIVHEYACGDGTSTWQLFDAQMQEIRFQNLEKCYDIETRCIPIIHDMVWRGIRIDMDRLREVEQECQRRLQQAMAALPAGFNVRSPAQLKKYFDERGVHNYPKTDKGNASFTAAFLTAEPLGASILAVRKYSNLMNTFIEPLRNKHVHNGRIHPQYAQSRDDKHGTVTGRFSSYDPNMQQIPKRDKAAGKLFRSIFLPEDGAIWGSVDWQQAEPHLLAHYLGKEDKDNALTKGYLQDPPLDAHTAVANIAKIDRQSAKTLNQAMIGGAGSNRVIAEMATKGKTEAEARATYDAYFAGLPALKPLQKRMSDVYARRGYMRTLSGRRCRLEDSKFGYKALNRILQGGNADMIKAKLAEVGEYLLRQNNSVRILANIHDALEFSFKEEDRETYEECLKIMTRFGPDDVLTIDVPIGVDADEGGNWAIASYKDLRKADG